MGWGLWDINLSVLYDLFCKSVSPPGESQWPWQHNFTQTASSTQTVDCINWINKGVVFKCCQWLVNGACLSYLSSDWPSVCEEQRWLQPAGQGWWQVRSSRLVGRHVWPSLWQEQCCRPRWGWSYWLELKYKWSRICEMINVRWCSIVAPCVSCEYVITY